MNLKTLIASLLAVVASPAFIAAEAEASTQQATSQINWMTDYKAAVVKAKAENKPLFLLFEGSDWCSYCIKMNNQIIETPEFQQALADKLVFVMLDFPKKDKQDEEIKKQNKRLLEEYGVKGFPTVILVDPNLQKIAQMQYQQGGGALYAKKVQDALDAYSKK